MAIKLTIWLSASSDASHVFEHEGPEIVVGRDPGCHVQLPFSFVSGHHFTVISESSSWLIADQGSTNGTVLNGRKLAPYAYTPLRGGDLVSVGEILIQVDVVDEMSQSFSLEESGEEVRRMVWETLRARGASAETEIEVVAGPERGLRRVLGEQDTRVVLGSGPTCEIRLSDSHCHAAHLEVVRTGRGWEARPLNEQLTKVDGRPLVEPRALGRETRMTLGATQIVFRDPLQQYLDELSGLPEERKARLEGSASGRVLEDVLTTQQIADSVKRYEEAEARPDFGPPNRPPALGLPRLRSMPAVDPSTRSGDEAVVSEPRGWAAFEISMVVVTAVLIVGGLLAILMLFDVL